MRKTLIESLKVVYGIEPATVAGGGGLSAAADLVDAGSVMFIALIGNVVFDGSNYLVVKILESDLPDSGFTVATGDAVPDAENPTTGVYKTINGQSEFQYPLYYRGTKRYAQVEITAVGTGADALVAVASILGHLSFSNS